MILMSSEYPKNNKILMNPKILDYLRRFCKNIDLYRIVSGITGLGQRLISLPLNDI